jgi:hypothetical protein
MSSDMPDYDTGVIQELLLAAFTDKDLRRFCRDRRQFRPIVNYMGSGDALVDLADKVIEYCEKRSLLGELLVEIQRQNPWQYDRFAARLIVGAMLPEAARKGVRKVMAVCNRRAVFTQMPGQMNLKAMFASLADCRVRVQKLAAYVEPAMLQKLVMQIIAELDTIERCGMEAFRRLRPDRGSADPDPGEMDLGTWDLTRAERIQIDDAKLRIIQNLRALAAAASLSYSLPTVPEVEHYFTREEADQAYPMDTWY